MLIEEWALLPQEMLHQLVLSMRRRCKATIARCFQSTFRRDSASKPGTYESHLMRDQDCMADLSPRVAVWFCIAVAECGLALPDLRSPDHFLRIHPLDDGQHLPNGVSVACAFTCCFVVRS
ncbi:hypothetical protein TNCV_685081 [Trichonephila clavipes]|nr:hypothetical protein TNCV_685081 [Trichonephila clavipes]